MLKRQALFLFSTPILLAGAALASEAIPNWSAPATWSPARSRGLSAQDITNPLPFIGLAPCRIVDTRGGAPITGGIFTGGSDVRSYPVAGICGIPLSARALSLNFTITGPGQTTIGFLLAWPTGGPVPPVSTLNWDHVPAQIANAAVVPTGASVSFTVNVSAPTHVIIDVNGYYPQTDPAHELASGEFFALHGTFVGGPIIHAQNESGLNGIGVVGWANSTTGGGIGVEGVTRSPSASSAGVAGLDLSTNLPAGYNGAERAGVVGASLDGVGVLGVTEIGFSDGAVVGLRNDETGTPVSAGYLGFTLSTGVYFKNGLAGTGTKSFIEPHPTDASKVIRYVSIEGPEAGTYFRGRAKLQRGYATIPVPEHFQMVTDPESLSIQVTPIGETANMAVVRIGLDGILVKGSRDVEFFYLVNGVRRAYRDWDPIQENEKFFVPRSADERLPAYLSEEERQRLIANGTYNPDGTVNLGTASRLGWARIWEEKARTASGSANGPTAR